MIEVTVAYPAGQGRTFNTDYYLKTHIPLFQKRMGAAMKTIRVSRGIGGRFWCKLLKGSVSCDNCRDDGTGLGTRFVQGTAL
jgi:hypothetical protein